MTASRNQSISSQDRATPGTQRGQAVVEMAGAITFLLVLVIGIVDFTPAVVRGAQLTQAVRDGAAYARTATTDTTEIRKRVVIAAPSIYGTLTDAQIAALTDTQIAVACSDGLSGASKTCASATVGDSISVTANYNYQPVTGLFSVLLDAPVEISRSAATEIR